MKTQLVGYTGFVGSNLNGQFAFDELYDSKNIIQSYGKNPDLLVYAGVYSQKFLANKNPEKDFENIKSAIKNITEIKPKEIILISTVDVYKNPINVDEDTKIEIENLHPYGYNRYFLENWVRDNVKKHLIIRLPGLYGQNIKKNFIYDLINIIPQMLTEEKYNELLKKDDLIKEYYRKQENGFYKIKELEDIEKEDLKKYFNKIGFSALNFTDSRGKFQFYNLKFLWEHIQKARENNLEILNIATEPVTIGEIYQYIKNEEFINEIASNIPNYNFKTKYAKMFNGQNEYIFDKQFILQDIKKFVEKNI